MPNAEELIASLRGLCAPFEARREEFYETLGEIRKWCELGDKALQMEVTDRLRQKFYTCRRIWPIRKEHTPTSGETWEEWFERMFQQNIYDFARVAKEQNYRQKIMAFEVALYSHSPLQDEEQKRAVA